MEPAPAGHRLPAVAAPAGDILPEMPRSSLRGPMMAASKPATRRPREAAQSAPRRGRSRSPRTERSIHAARLGDVACTRRPAASEGAAAISDKEARRKLAENLGRQEKIRTELRMKAKKSIDVLARTEEIMKAQVDFAEFLIAESAPQSEALYSTFTNDELMMRIATDLQRMLQTRWEALHRADTALTMARATQPPAGPLRKRPAARQKT